MKGTKQLLAAAALAACSLSVARPAHAQNAKTAPAPHVTSTAKLRAEAKITEAHARATALAQVPNGKIESGELEREGGKLIYSYDIKVPAKPGIEEVHIDAMTGAVIAHEHESPEAEKKEGAMDAKKKSVRKP